jgi:hypothetical protein
MQLKQPLAMGQSVSPVPYMWLVKQKKLLKKA